MLCTFNVKLRHSTIMFIISYLIFFLYYFLSGNSKFLVYSSPRKKRKNSEIKQYVPASVHRSKTEFAILNKRKRRHTNKREKEGSKETGGERRNNGNVFTTGRKCGKRNEFLLFWDREKKNKANLKGFQEVWLQFEPFSLLHKCGKANEQIGQWMLTQALACPLHMTIYKVMKNMHAIKAYMLNCFEKCCQENDKTPKIQDSNSKFQFQGKFQEL